LYVRLLFQLDKSEFEELQHVERDEYERDVQ